MTLLPYTVLAPESAWTLDIRYGRKTQRHQDISFERVQTNHDLESTSSVTSGQPEPIQVGFGLVIWIKTWRSSDFIHRFPPLVQWVGRGRAREQHQRKGFSDGVPIKYLMWNVGKTKNWRDKFMLRTELKIHFLRIGFIGTFVLGAAAGRSTELVEEKAALERPNRWDERVKILSNYSCSCAKCQNIH